MWSAGVWRLPVYEDAVEAPASRIAMTFDTNYCEQNRCNAYGGGIFTDTDGGFYQIVPNISGVQHYTLVDNEWMLLADEGLHRQQYAQDLIESTQIAD